MTRLDEIRAWSEAVPAAPWEAVGSGPSRGDHWCVCADGEGIVWVACNDGENEEQREPLARFMAAAPDLLAAVEAALALHKPNTKHFHGTPQDKPYTLEFCGHEGDSWPCPTVTAITGALNARADTAETHEGMRNDRT